MFHIKKAIRSSTVMAAVLLSGAAIGQPAIAAELETWTASVRVADLDLSTAGGQATLRQRLLGAVRSHYDADDLRDPIDRSRDREYRRLAVDRATAQADVLVAAAQQKTRIAARRADPEPCVKTARLQRAKAGSLLD